ncbi:hypothetical protein, partial [Plesiomonas shigelloides]|uniref:hypothetical protein n=1 Tax=Plesiomonas shigelloides TaxID=703 RepID=UPI001C49BF4F
ARHQISEEPILTDGLFAFLGFVFSSSFPAIYFLFPSLISWSSYLFYTLPFELLIDGTSI